jgi:hypothetical protein
MLRVGPFGSLPFHNVIGALILSDVPSQGVSMGVGVSQPGQEIAPHPGVSTACAG